MIIGMIGRSLDDVWICYQDMANAPFSGPVDTSGTMAILALHVFHILAFQPLPLIDWIHHLVMIVLMLPLAWALRPGALLGHGAFWASGLPGGLDYLMLVLVKKRWLDKITEKRVFAHISNWMRMPGCLMHSFLTIVGWQQWQRRGFDDPTLPNSSLLPDSLNFFAVFVISATFFWNGPFFLRRVIESCTVAELALRAAVKSPSPSSSSSTPAIKEE